MNNSGKGIICVDSFGRLVGQTAGTLSNADKGLVCADSTGRVVSISRAAMAKGGKGILLPDSLGRLVAAQLLATRDVAVNMAIDCATTVTMRVAGPAVSYRAPTGYYAHSWSGDASYPNSNIVAAVTRTSSQYWYIWRIFWVLNLGTMTALRGYTGPVWYRFKSGSLMYSNGISPNSPIPTSFDLFMKPGQYSPQYDILPGAAQVFSLPITGATPAPGLFFDQVYIYLGQWPAMGQYVTFQGMIHDDEAWIATKQILDTEAFYQYAGADGAGIVLQDMNNSLSLNADGASGADMQLAATRALAMAGGGLSSAAMQLTKE